MRIQRWLCAAAPYLFLAALSLSSQEPPKGPGKDYSKESFVIEKILNNVTFENDGTSTIETDIRVRIQSASGVQDWGLLQLPYPSLTGDAAITNVRVTKSGGAVVETPSGSAQDMPAQITVAAPSYSDLKVKQLAVRGLDAGDVLEFHETSHTRSALIPGQFWFNRDFATGAVILDEELRISVPKDRPVLVKSPKLQPNTAQENAYVVYTWKTAKLDTQAERDAAEKEKANSAVASDVPFSDVQLTSFRTWDQVGEWYRELQESRITPTPEIRAKAAEITRGSTSDDAKIRALYDYVATKFRYVGVSFGIGRYQPHAAVDVLNNGYGDCKDKHTLLASLLAAEGIKAYPVLINSSKRIDPDVPSPGQFDHVITVVPEGQVLLWLDTTPEVAPFGLLIGPLRDSQALMIDGNGPAKLTKTPADPPFKQSLAFSIGGKMNSDGTLDAKVDVSVRGDLEVPLRTAFHRASPAQWKDIVQAVSEGWNFSGSVDDVTTGSPEVTEAAFNLKYTYTRKGYPNWPDVLRPPLPPVNLPQLPDGTDSSSEPIRLQSPGEFLLEAEITLPPNISMRPRPAVDIKKDFAEYHATYFANSNGVHIERHLTIVMREIPRSRSGEYRDFWKTVDTDTDSVVSLFSSAPATSLKVDKPGESSMDAEVEKLLDLADVLFSQDPDGAIEKYRQASQMSPSNARAHYGLGNVFFNKGNYDEAITEHRKALSLRPDYAEAHRSLADALLQKNDVDGAIAEYQEARRLNLDDSDTHGGLGDALYRKKDFMGAMTEYREALKLAPEDLRSLRGLGDSFYSTRDFDAAMIEYREALRVSSDDSYSHNGVANVLFQKNDFDGAIAEYRESLRLMPNASDVHLDLAETFLKKQDLDGAISEFREALRLKPETVQAHMDLGQTLFRRGQVDQAIEELKKGIALAPQAPQGYQMLGAAYMSLHREDDALAIWKQFEKASPDNSLAVEDISALLIQRKQYPEAIAELQSAIERSPKNSQLLFLLGRATVRSGNVEGGLARMRKSLEADSSPNWLNVVAYELVDQNISLDDALNYSRQAVKQQEDKTAGISLASLTPADLRNIAALAAYWDTLGWIQFRLGHMEEAEKYLTAAWSLGQFPAIGDHLGQLYDKTGNKQQAVHYYAMTLATGHAPQETASRLAVLVGGKSQADEDAKGALDSLMKVRTVTLPRVSEGKAQAEFFVLYGDGPNGMTEDARFIKGSETLRGAAEAVKSSHYDATFPDGVPTKLVRRGIVDCPASGTSCQLVFLPVETVNSVN